MRNKIGICRAKYVSIFITSISGKISKLSSQKVLKQMKVLHSIIHPSQKIKRRIREMEAFRTSNDIVVDMNYIHLAI